ncbi:helix-hairpin-helix domain-containing protein [Pseudomonas sp. R5(2019)]|uniref:helix-hairpin-helix domain-containing protein n=1 Tax=Pseudomonas sp. R5(2019) TaxID=2697566 RepID=UPI001411F0C0|nr:helix-hairpin-helix domain-containing protein [Pseudomonas sp. R5(2019)]NBA97281.1 competence protein ComEA [Pseudomonas sp. R5(2019)]
MRKAFLSSVLFALFTSFALPAAAVTPQAMQEPEVMIVDTAKVAAVDLNSADAQTLQKELAGIGRTKAEAIVAYRESQGKFESVDELLEVKGIGKALLDRNRDKLTLN